MPEIRQEGDTMGEFLGKRVIPRHEGDWDKARSYEPLMIVLDPETGDGYISRYDVPAGTLLTNEHYWARCSHFNAQMHRLETDVAEDVEGMHTDLANTKSAMSEELSQTHQKMAEELSETENRMGEKVTAATSAMKDTQNSMDAAVAQMNKRLDANVTASTDSKADYAAELVDTRVDSEGTTYPSAGEAIRSITAGLARKIAPTEMGTAYRNENTVQNSMEGAAVHCLVHHVSGYTGTFLGFFSSYEECKEKSFRVVILSNKVPYEGQAIITNSPNAWGSDNGKVGCVALGAVKLNEENGYPAAFDLDFSESRWEEFVTKYTASRKFYFCIRREKATAQDSEFYVYAYETTDVKDFGWKYVSEHDCLRILEQEIINARAGEASLPQLLRAHEAILKEVTDCHTDSAGVEYDSLAERLKLIDAMAAPRLPVSSYFAPRDNTNGELKTGAMGVSAVGENVQFKFDHTAYVTEYEQTAWSSVHFAFCISYEQMMKLKGLDRLYLELFFEGVGEEGNKEQTGKVLNPRFYVNSVGNWASSVNPSVVVPITVGSKVFYHLEQEMVEKVLEKERPLYIVFAGSFMDNAVVKDLGQVCLTVSIVNQRSSGILTPFISYADSAETAAFANEAGKAIQAENASYAENADYAGSAGSAVIADNFFLVPAEELLNHPGVRYSSGLDTLAYPEKYPYAYRFGFQSTGNRASAKISGTGFDQVVEFSIGLSKESDQPHNQGYAKQLSGMMSFDEMLRKFEEGYQYCYLCEIEEFENCPEGVQGGAYDNRLLIAYYLDGKFTNPINVSPVLKRIIYGNRKMYVWRFAFTQEILEAIQVQKEAGTFSASWFGIWNTRKYSGEEPVVWTPKWYWQDYAFADDSFSNEDMATFFQSKYTYWCSYVNHGKLKERFAEVDASLEQLKSGAEKAEERLNGQEARIKNLEKPTVLTGIVCWGDSLTAGGGWTSTLQKLSGIPVYNGGTGGENARTIAARQGADVMLVNNITIPAACEPVTIAVRKTDSGILTEEGYKVTPLLQGGAHVNPVKIGEVEGTLRWTGTNYADTNGIWTFTRSAAGEAVTIKRPTAVRTAFDRLHNQPSEVMILFIGQNGGYADLTDLIRMHQQMISHFKGKEYLVLGLSSGTESQRAEYEKQMKQAFGRRFVSLREYLAHPVYDTDGKTVISCYGLDDAGLDPTDADIERIKQGQVPQTLLADSVHYTAVAQANNVAVCDLWHESGINRRTWSVFGAQKNAVNEQYAKYQLDASGKVVGSTPQRYVNGQSYYQKRNGSIVLEKYTGSSPYPFNGDQLHCSTEGYARIGECVVGSVIRTFGK